MKKRKNYDILVMGFALFAMFFGSGNVLFPPYLGMIAGKQWLPASLAYLISDILMAMLAIIVMVKSDGRLSAITGRIGEKASHFLNLVVMLCICPLFVVPRSSAATFDVIAPLFGLSNSKISVLIFTAIFFILVYYLTAVPSKVMSIIGNILTPILLISIAVLVVKGVFTPAGELAATPHAESVIQEGIITGYHSMDLFGSLNLGLVIIATAYSRGYRQKEEMIEVVKKSTIICAALLVLITFGLAYLGSTSSQIFDQSASQSTLIYKISTLLFGQIGGTIVALTVGLACFTTASGLIAGTANYFEEVLPVKMSYKRLVFYACLLSGIIANFGFDMLVKLTVPVLTVTFPVTIVLTILSLFGNRIKKDSVFKGAALGTLIGTILTVLSEQFHVDFVIDAYLPFFEQGFGWLLLAVIGIVIGYFWLEKA
ncbi:branched-chain amino acid transport system II carrier protein [Aerococcus christensenii]|uniref:branched-chain amino acid transport system II carrier protein n=1 Tax=Aerococcus christensenii TaxID=87541 RepID=UPI0023A9FF3B|nr:branched-chain amino acid transport system II carrier protein [Aerococcus christensenii]WEB70863.1 branched-chain amino acid transport system II carrier protein [Aerococcus christensenii]